MAEAAKPAYETMGEILEDVDKALSGINGHPLDWLMKELGDPDKKKAFAHSAVKFLLEADPSSRTCAREKSTSAELCR